MSILIILALGPACLFYGYVLLNFWREMSQREAEPEMAQGIVALPESSVIQMQLDRRPAWASGGRKAWSRVVLFEGSPERANREQPAGSSPVKATIHHWPGTKDAA